MKLRKIGCVCLAIVMLLSSLATIVFADASAEEKQAQILASVKTRIGDTSRYTHFDSSSRTAKNGVVTYRFDWWNEKESYDSLSVACTSGGVITEYSIYDSQSERREGKIDIHKMPMDEAMVKAKTLMDKLNPQLAGTLELSAYSDAESLYDTGYTFEIQRVENGIPFYGQSGRISINANADAIEDFYINYDETVPVIKPETLISKAQAEATYAQMLTMELIYKAEYKERICTIYPVYVPASPSYMYVSATKYNTVLDMRSTYSGDNFLHGGTLGDSADKNEAMGEVTFTPAEMEELENVEGLLNSDALLRTVLANPILDVPDDLKLSNVSRNKNIYTNQYLYSYTLQSTKEDNYDRVYVCADARTGALLEFDVYRSAGFADAEKDMQQAAEAATKSLTGDVFAEYRAATDITQPNAVRYYRYVNDVVYRADSIYVVLNPENGKVARFAMSYTDVEFPSVEGAMTPVQAAEAMFAVVGYAPYYMAKYDADGNAQVEVVYVLDERKPTAVDPFTGTLLQSYANVPYVENKWNGYSDIEGHYAQVQIETLARFGIRFDDDVYLPDQVITQSEFVSLLSAAFYNDGGIIGEDKELAYRRAASYGIVSADERADGAPVNRSTAALYMIRALGLDEVASLQGIYKCPFADVTENIGHISILNAMGVVRGDGNGNYNPEGALTRADAAILIYNYLSR